MCSGNLVQIGLQRHFLQTGLTRQAGCALDFGLLSLTGYTDVSPGVSPAMGEYSEIFLVSDCFSAMCC